MPWIYLSPHLDDVSFSCGGLLWEQGKMGEDVEIWTICAGDPPEGPFPSFAESLHQNWGTGSQTPAQRREEDEKACAALGAKPRWFEIPDCIYRRHLENGEALYNSSAAVFGAIHAMEQTHLVTAIAQEIQAALPKQANLVTPISLGSHVDHQLVRSAAEQLNLPLWYYADYPYVLKNEHLLSYLLPRGSKGKIFPISKNGLAAWKKSAACYKSQLSTFWPEPGGLERAYDLYWGQLKGIQLWASQVPN